MIRNVLYYQSTEKYGKKEEDVKPGKTEQKIKYGHTEDGEIHAILPEIEVIGDGLMKKLRSYLNDPELNSGLEKISDSLIKRSLSEEFKQFETMDISEELRNILDKCPKLLYEISGTLGLPISEKKFSNLSAQQKIRFYELYKAVHGSLENSPTIDSIKNSMEVYKKDVELKLYEEFLKQSIKSLDDFKDTLGAFGLTKWEIKKVGEFSSFLDRHSELLGTRYDLRDLRYNILAGHNKELVAGTALASKTRLPWPAYVVIGAAMVGGVWYASEKIKDYFTINPETISGDGWTEIEDPIEVMKFVGVEIPFKKAGTDTIVPFDVDTTKLKFDKSKRKDLREYYERMKNNAKNLINKPETRIIEMVVEGVAQGVFDLKKYRMFYNEGTGELRLQLPEPTMEPKDINVPYIKDNMELIHYHGSDYGPENLKQRLTKEAIDSIESNEEFYSLCELIAAEQLQSYVKSISDALNVKVNKITVTIGGLDLDPVQINKPLKD